MKGGISCCGLARWLGLLLLFALCAATAKTPNHLCFHECCALPSTAYIMEQVANLAETTEITHFLNHRCVWKHLLFLSKSSGFESSRHHFCVVIIHRVCPAS